MCSGENLEINRDSCSISSLYRSRAAAEVVVEVAWYEGAGAQEVVVLEESSGSFFNQVWSPG